MEQTSPPDHDKTLTMQIGEILRKNHLMLATAESCTGGQIASKITAVAGASHYFESGIIAYSNRAKIRLLSIPEERIEKEGAVSSAVAQAMAEGVRKNANVDLGLSVTGIAGPDGGKPEKPLGLVFIALSDQNKTEVKRFLFSGSRNAIQSKASQAALKILITYLKKHYT